MAQNPREHSFPSTTMSRTSQNASAKSTRSGYSDSDSTVASLHPLESSSPSADAITSPNTSYLPYMPRQRGTATINQNPIAAPTQNSHARQQSRWLGDITAKMQLMQLKTNAQGLGLESSTAGWAILEKLANESTSQGSEWASLWNAITTGKTSLAHVNDENVMIETMKDHIAFLESSPPSKKGSQLVTLSGLRGTIHGNTLTFRSIVHPSSNYFRVLSHSATRSTGFSALSSLPLSSQYKDTNSIPTYPSYTCPGQSCFVPTILPIPTRSASLPTIKPPPPPRSTVRSMQALTHSNLNLSSAPSTSSHRIPNPFASLFGHAKNTSTSSNQPANIAGVSAPSSPSIPAANVPTGDLEPPAHQQPVVDVSIIIIDRKIVRSDVAKDVNRAIYTEISHSLAMGCDYADDMEWVRWVRERVNRFVEAWMPFVYGSADEISANSGKTHETTTAITDLRERLNVAIAGRGASHGHRTEPKMTLDTSGDERLVLNSLSEAPEDMANRLQLFLGELEEEVRMQVVQFVDKRNRDEGRVEKGEEDVIPEKQEQQEKVERLVKTLIERVERVICVVFYDRLFKPSSSDDASHDETLSSRVLALNRLDLGLEHLDIDVGDFEREIEEVITECGSTMLLLETCFSPAEKASVIVEAHKVVVYKPTYIYLCFVSSGGLSRLPPVRLLPEKARVQRTKQIMKVLGEGGELKEIQSQDQPALVPTVIEPVDGVVESEGTLASIDQQKKRPSPLVLSDAEPYPSPNHVDSSTIADLPQDSGRLSPTAPTPVSGDVLLPIIIFSVAKANPPHLVSHLLFTQRFRNQIVSDGEERYCLINLMAVVEFLENVDLQALGLVDDEQVLSAAQLTPIPIVRSPVLHDSVGEMNMAGSLRGKVEQQVDAITGSANKILAGVMDTSFGMLRSLLPGRGQDQMSSSIMNVEQPSTLSPTPTIQHTGRPGFGLLKKESGFSIASIAASLPLSRGGEKTNSEEDGQQLLTVSRPPSITSNSQRRGGFENEEGDSVEEEYEECSNEDEGEGVTEKSEKEGTKSIKSFESMMGERSGKEKRFLKKNRTHPRTGEGSNTPNGPSEGVTGRMPRKSLSDRLADMSALAGTKQNSPPTSTRNSTVPTIFASSSMELPSSRPVTPLGDRVRLSPPVQRFLECTPDDLRISEVAELLQEYRRLVDKVRALGGFNEA
ncbi:hypothetical protein AMATHDRAFT_51216 [Amanita thiersii Skay4041]|uniref:VPS9 domain-containing protein n=1 Tax=Amanita thiersii Skay4041 TaxID=703135 RepID=A0A2A9N8N3_9AGAR|nr:hypothetical protein AMATHDRAFT_51216 [Amanita thiersii Skay4041]